mmetsp:Transcript_12688/g.12527  ORF Transcript_12688/g.12527 Transcript_12688/m.12527 type:complete len:102 (-) Transcript_12688:221-526(-)
MTLILMNLLIAIISDTYERVSSKFIEEDGKELNDLILEYEAFYVWNKNKGSSQYLHWASNNDVSIGSEWQGRVQEISRAVSKGKTELENIIEILRDNLFQN